MKTTKTSLLILCAYFAIAASKDASRDGSEFTWVRHDNNTRYQIIECGAEVTLSFLPFDHPRGVLVEENKTCHLSWVRDSDPINARNDSIFSNERNFEFEPVLWNKQTINQCNQVQQIRQQTPRTYCPNQLWFEMKRTKLFSTTLLCGLWNACQFYMKILCSFHLKVHTFWILR